MVEAQYPTAKLKEKILFLAFWFNFHNIPFALTRWQFFFSFFSRFDLHWEPSKPEKSQIVEIVVLIYIAQYYNSKKKPRPFIVNFFPI